MNVKEIHVSSKFVKNLGNYQSYTVEAGVIAEIVPGDSVEDAYKDAWDLVKAQITEQIANLKSNKEVK